MKRDGALVRNNCMAVAPDGYSASNFAGSASSQGNSSQRQDALPSTLRATTALVL